MHKPDWFPTERQILSDIAHDFSQINANENAAYARLIPGFEKVRVNGVECGRWLTAEAAFGEGGDTIVGAEFIDDTVSHWVAVFRKPEFKARYAQRQAEIKAVRRASSPAKDDPEKRIENAIAEARRAAGHIIRQQVNTPSGIVDIVDETDRVVIEVKAHSKTTFVMAALNQLDRYIPHFEGYAQAVGLPEPPVNHATLRSLRSLGIAVFTPSNPLSDWKGD